MKALILAGVVTFLVGITIWSIRRSIKNENGCSCGCECDSGCHQSSKLPADEIK